VWGVTFSELFAKAFQGVEWHDAYKALFNDLGVKHLRLVAYWDSGEPEKGEYNFADLDWQISYAAQHNADIILAVGRKLPRWPECHIPDWAANLSEDTQESAAIAFMQRVVERYKNNPAIIGWQVENEPFLKFGGCPPITAAYVDRAIAAVKSVDSTRPVIVTDSGELSTWVPAATRADIFGTTMYRYVWHQLTGVFEYPIPPVFFRVKRALAELLVGPKRMIVIELQAESWLHHQPYETTVAEQYTSVNPKRFKGIISYAEQTGFDTFYLWGDEWWYWLKTTQHKPEMWNIAKELFVHSQ
jgi:Cellulase (glycosyl hydrolase family 5)